MKLRNLTTIGIIVWKCCLTVWAQGGLIKTVAGNGSEGYSGDGGNATAAQLSLCLKYCDGSTGIAVDGSGNLIIADEGNGVVRKVSNGIIATIVSKNVISSAYGSNAYLPSPSAIAVDSAGDLFIADIINGYILRVSGGVARVVAGQGTMGPGRTGEGVPATSVTIGPAGIAVDSSGNIFFSDLATNTIRKVAANGIITTVAGNGNSGFSGDGGPALLASLNLNSGLAGVAVDTSGNLFFTDVFNFRVRKVAPSGIITTVAGNGVFAFKGDGGPATQASIGEAFGIAVDPSGNLFIADWYNNRVRMVSGGGMMSTVAGDGIQGFSGDGGPAISASMWGPGGVAVDAFGNVFVLDDGNNRVREVMSCSVKDSLILDAFLSDMQATFSPPPLPNNPTPTLLDYAKACGFTSFEWQQVITVMPANVNGDVIPSSPALVPNNVYPAACSAVTPAIWSGSGCSLVAGPSLLTGNALSYPFLADPPNGGYYQPPTPNSYPFYYPLAVFAPGAPLLCTVKNGCPPFQYIVSPDGKATTFLDDPAAPGLPGDPIAISPLAGHFAAFQTSLVGVDSQIQPHNLYSWTWNTTYNGTSGGVAITAVNGGAPFTSALASPAQPSPLTGATGVTTALMLTWSAVSGATSYDVYLGTSAPPPLVTNVPATSYAPGKLNAGTTYYWRVVARTSGFKIGSGPAWSFTTGPASVAAPSIHTGGVVPASGSLSTIEPGEWVSIYGNDLASSAMVWNGNFPTSLGGTSVTINGRSSYLSYVSPTQINLQAPDDTATGLVPVVVTTPGGSATATVTLAQFAPSFLLLDGKHVAGIIPTGGQTYNIIGPTGNSLGYQTLAAKAGDTIELFATGFGPTSPTVPPGTQFVGAAPTTSPVSVLINGTSVTPTFAGLSGAGLYQINLTVPAGLGTGDLPLVALVGGGRTQSGVVISVQ
jgi:uncharacterized protein (TIGR03437 family)